VRAALVVGIVAVGCQGGPAPRPAFGEPVTAEPAAGEPAPTRPRRQLRLELGVHEGVPWPVILAPIEDFDRMPALPVAAEPPPAAPTAAGARVVEIVDGSGRRCASRATSTRPRSAPTTASTTGTARG
jgi:hypothetical protein